MHSTLTGKVAIVTGVSRKQGIGAAIAQQLARAGATIFTTYYRPYDVEIALAKEGNEAAAILANLRSGGAEAVGLEVDLSLPSAPATIFDAAAMSISWSTMPRGIRLPTSRRLLPPRLINIMPSIFGGCCCSVMSLSRDSRVKPADALSI